MGALAYAIQLLDVIPALIAAGTNISKLLADGKAAMTAMQAEGRDPTSEEWDALNATIAALRKELHAE